MRYSVTGERYKHRAGLRMLAGAILLWMPIGIQAQPAFTISTVAGNGSAGFSGDGGPASAAQLNNPCMVRFDGSHNLYIGDQVNYRIRKVTADGNISTIAGNGTAGDTGAGGAATSASIRTPCGMTFDGSGNLIFADTTNHEVKKITTGGTISTIVGTGTGGYAGDHNPANQAQLNKPNGVVFDAAGNLYIADSGNNVIRMVAPSGTITTFAGTTAAGYSGDGGPAGSAAFNNPTGLAIDAAGNLYVADTNNGVIRKIAPGGTVVVTIAGTGSNSYSGDGGPATLATLNNPRGVAVDSGGNIYIADTVNSRIRLINRDGLIQTVAGNSGLGYSGDGGPAAQATLFYPTSLTIDSSGNVYVADTQNSVIRQLTPPPPPVPPSVGGVISASEFGAFHAAAPGSWIELYGLNLAAATRNWTHADFNGNNAPTSLNQTSATIAGQSTFVSYISPGQVNVQVPSNVGPGPQQLTLTTPGGTSAAIDVTINATEPGLYAPTRLLVGGNQYTAEFNDNTMTFVMPTGAAPGINSRPAHAGDTIVVWGVGFGPVTPNTPAGQVVQQNNTLNNPVQFSVGGVPANTTYSGLAPQQVGLYQFNVVVPNVTPGNAVPITFNQGGVAGTQTLYIAVQ